MPFAFLLISLLLEYKSFTHCLSSLLGCLLLWLLFLLKILCIAEPQTVAGVIADAVLSVSYSLLPTPRLSPVGETGRTGS